MMSALNAIRSRMLCGSRREPLNTDTGGGSKVRILTSDGDHGNLRPPWYAIRLRLIQGSTKKELNLFCHLFSGCSQCTTDKHNGSTF